MPGRPIHIEVDGVYFKQGLDFSPEQKQEAADAAAQAAQAKLSELGATFPNSDLAGATHDPEE